MTQYLIDTTPLAALVSSRASVVSLVTPWMHAHQAATSILVYGEVLEALKGRPGFSQRKSDLITLLGEIAPYFITHAIMERYADLRRQLRQPYGPGLIGDIDTLIAATALEYDLTLVTADGDFLRVPGLEAIASRPTDPPGTAW